MTTTVRDTPSTPLAVVALLFTAVGLTMLLAVGAVASLAIGSHVLGAELAVLAVAVAAGTRLVTERADRSHARG